jgi:arylsulfatase A-like enzyme
MAAWDAGFPQSRKRGDAMAFGRFAVGAAFPPSSPRLQLHRFALTALILAATVISSAYGGQPAGSRSTPNIVFILADDLGYGDVKCLNPEGKIATPNLDRLAAGGMICTDAHSSSSVCTPTRYGILTGRYNWRSALKSGVLGGLSRRLIEPGRLTVPALLKQKGYATACIGKWHLGMDWPLKDGGFATDYPDGWQVDYTRPIQNGPTAVGFDYFFGISASLDMPPYVFIENDRATAVPTVEKTWIRKGPAAAEFEALDVLPTLTRKAVNYIGERAAAAKAGTPFFLYLPLNAPHTPILPTAEWQGKSGLNAYGDFVLQVDAAVGQILRTLDERGLAENTLVVFTSDNGCSPAAKIDEMVAKGHDPSYHFRGHKADIFDGGHRIPFLVRWPARIKAGSTSDQLICLTDLMATCTEIVGAKLPDNAGEDSVSLLPAFLGQADKPLREAVVHHSINGSFSIREGRWKLELCPDSGGWSAPRPGSPAAKKLTPVQLYDLSRDIGEETNVQEQHPDVVQRLTGLLEKYVADGRSTPGALQPNTGEVDIWYGPKSVKRLQAGKAAVPVQK